MIADMDARNRIIADYMGKTVHVVVDRPVGYCHGGIIYPINYGYIPGTIAGDGEEQDAYILGISEPLKEFDGQVIGAVRRLNDLEDKLVVAPVGQRYHQGQIRQAVDFQERYFESRVFSAFEKSCGVLAYRERQGKREFILVYESHSRCWSLPKGHMEAGETEADTALRELWEETGLHAELDQSRVCGIEYAIGEAAWDARKQVVFFLGKASGREQAQAGEIDRCKWVTEEELPCYLFPDTYAACRKLLE